MRCLQDWRVKLICRVHDEPRTALHCADLTFLTAAQALTLIAVLVQNNKMLHIACSVALRSLLALLLQLQFVCNSGDTASLQYCCQDNTVLNIIRGKQFLRASRVGSLLRQDSIPRSQWGHSLLQRLVSLKNRPCLMQPCLMQP